MKNNTFHKIIKNQETFKEDNQFSRNKYEKFLIENRLNAVTFENNVSKQEEKKQLLTNEPVLEGPYKLAKQKEVNQPIIFFY